jgi:hypothetical protein
MVSFTQLLAHATIRKNFILNRLYRELHPLPYPVGYGLPVEAVVALIPAIVSFNATQALISVLVGHFLARAIRRTKVANL